MKRIILSENEKESLLNLHINKGYKTFISEQDNKTSIGCDKIIEAIGYNARGNKGDTSLVTPQKWYEYFGIKLEDTNSSEIKSSLSQLKNDTENGVKKSYTFKNLTLPINLTNKYLKLQEDSCCINIKEGIIGNYDFNITDLKSDGEESVADGKIRILIRYENIEKVNCNE
jgi:hypothetical protein